MKRGLTGFVRKESICQRSLKVWDYDRLAMLIMLL